MQHDTIVNGRTGERLTFGHGTDGGGRETVAVSVTLPAGEDGPPLHVHPTFSERFEVVEGRFGLRVAGVESVLEVGESATVPPGTPHTWWNAGETPVRVRGSADGPNAERLEPFLTTYFTLVNTGRTNAVGRPGLLQSAVWLDANRDVNVPVLPRPLAVLLRLLAPAGRALGYRSTLEYVPPADEYPGSDAGNEREIGEIGGDEAGVGERIAAETDTGGMGTAR